MKMNSVKKALGLGITLSVVVSLTGCGGAFRNRAFDYTRTDVKQVPPLQVPVGVSSPDFQPALTVAPGQYDYPAGGMPVMTPPNYNDTYKVNKKTKQATQLTSASDASNESVMQKPVSGNS